MHKETKATSIPPKVKAAVLERDGWCVWCGRPGEPNAHFIPRSHGGLGIEENILTLCPDCHRAYDFGPHRAEMRKRFKAYLMARYPDWDETKLIYRKDKK